jgi:hypothetical protein
MRRRILRNVESVARCVVMLYNCGSPKTAQILARVAATPWGPWTQPTLLLDPEIDNRACQLFWQAPGHDVADACNSLRVQLRALEAELKDSQPVPDERHPPKPPPNLNGLIRQIERTRDELNTCVKFPETQSVIKSSHGCDARPNEWPGKQIDGALYAPFVMERYTTRAHTLYRIASKQWCTGCCRRTTRIK